MTHVYCQRNGLLALIRWDGNVSRRALQMVCHSLGRWANNSKCTKHFSCPPHPPHGQPFLTIYGSVFQHKVIVIYLLLHSNVFVCIIGVCLAWLWFDVVQYVCMRLCKTSDYKRSHTRRLFKVRKKLNAY